MFDVEEFRDLIRRVRAGDEHAARALVRDFEPLIRREVRLRLEDQELRRVLDTVDVSQSVLASFFLRTASGEFEFDRPDQLAAMLVKMTRNKVASAARKQYRMCRDTRRTQPHAGALDDLASADPNPCESLAHEDLLASLRLRLSLEERRLADLRAHGCSWDDIARDLGGTPQSRRMQLTRGIERAGKELGIGELLYD